MAVVGPRLSELRTDSLQVKSINEFTESLGRELGAAEGTPGKALTRELLAAGLRRALEAGSAEQRQHFLDALAGNIHKFPLQEQRSLARVFPVEISSEYSNLASFVDAAGEPEEEPRSSGACPTAAVPGGVLAVLEGSGASAGEDAGPLGDLRKSLAALPLRPSAAAEELGRRLVSRETVKLAEVAGPKSRSAFFADLRLNLFKLPEATQKDIVDRFPDLRVEIARLAESMTQEISRWLDEERQISLQRSRAAELFPKLKALFQAILSATFLATFKLLGSSEKRCKETCLLKLALCLRKVSALSHEVAYDTVVAQAGQLRRHFFYVEGYGELMEDWLNNRIKQYNEEFTNRVAAVLASNPQPVLARLRRTFRPGRWLAIADPLVEEDLFALFLDDNFPHHVLTTEAVAAALQKVASYGGATCDFQVYRDIARLPPAAGAAGVQPAPQDAVEVALLPILQRLPPFPPLRRTRPGHYMFGRLEVQFLLRGSAILARVTGSASAEVPAEEFFVTHGPLEYPMVSATAVEVSLQSPGGAPATTIEAAADPTLAAPPPSLMLPQPMAPALQPPLPLPPLPAMPGQGMSGPAPCAGYPGLGLAALPRAPAPAQRYEPYPMPSAEQVRALLPPPGRSYGGFTGPTPTPPAPGGTKFGVDDDEI